LQICEIFIRFFYIILIINEKNFIFAPFFNRFYTLFNIQNDFLNQYFYEFWKNGMKKRGKSIQNKGCNAAFYFFVVCHSCAGRNLIVKMRSSLQGIPAYAGMTDTEKFILNHTNQINHS
jgi:hypothetical protein